MVTIYHNPKCTKSRQTLQLLMDRGIEPNIVLYLDSPPDQTKLEELLKKLGITARALLRKGEEAYRENNLNNPDLTEKELIDFMVRYPKLIERPIVVNGAKAALGRPPEAIIEIL